MHKRIRSLVVFMAGVLLGAIIYGNAKRILSSPSAQTTPQRWEYRVVTSAKAGFRGGIKGDADSELNQLGAQGFEICEMTQSSASGAGYYLTIVLRRPKQ